MLVVLHSRHICNAWTRTLPAALAASHLLAPSRLFHVGLTISFSRNRTTASEETISTPSGAVPEKSTATPGNTPYKYWSNDELERLRYLYSDGKDPTTRSIIYLFPGRTADAIYMQLLKIRHRVRLQIWSPEEKSRLLEMHDADVSTYDMLGHFPGRTHQSILSQLRRSLPDTHVIDKRREVSSSVLGEANAKYGDHSGTQDNGAIVIDIGPAKPKDRWTEEEDDILRKLVKKSKERNPDRWTPELSYLLSNPQERMGLPTIRSLSSALKRLDRLETEPFLAKNTWTKDEDELLRISVYTQLGIQLDSLPSDLRPDTHQKPKNKDETPPSDKRLLGPWKKRKEEERWPKVSLNQLKTVDWNRVALYVGARSVYGCQRRFDSHTLLEKGKHWKEEELEKLKAGLRKYGRNWVKVASVVGTKTASQASAKYQRLVHQQRTRTMT